MFSTIGKITPFSTSAPKEEVEPAAETAGSSEIEKMTERVVSK